MKYWIEVHLKTERHFLLLYHHKPPINFQGLVVMIGMVEKSSISVTCHEILQTDPLRDGNNSSAHSVRVAPKTFQSRSNNYLCLSVEQIKPYCNTEPNVVARKMTITDLPSFSFNITETSSAPCLGWVVFSRVTALLLEGSMCNLISWHHPHLFITNLFRRFCFPHM